VLFKLLKLSFIVIVDHCCILLYICKGCISSTLFLLLSLTHLLFDINSLQLVTK